MGPSWALAATPLSLAGSFASAVVSATAAAGSALALAFAGVTGLETTLVLAAARRGMGGGGPEEAIATAGDAVRDGTVGAAAGVAGRESGRGMLAGVDGRSGGAAAEEDRRCLPRMGERGTGGRSELVEVGAGAGVAAMVEEDAGASVVVDPFVSSAVAGSEDVWTGVFSLLSCLFGSGGGIDDCFEGLTGGSGGGTLLDSGAG